MELNALEVIREIASHPECTNVVVLDEGDMDPMEAVYYFSGVAFPLAYAYRIDTEIEEKTLHIYAA